MRKEIRIIIAAAVIYTLWLAYSLLEKFGIVDFLSSGYLFSFGFLAAALFCTVAAAAKIEYFRYKSFILIAAFIFGGVFMAYSADMTYRMLYGKALYLMPFGSIDFFLFCLLSAALMKQMRLRDNKKAQFTALALIPALLFILPVYFHLLQSGWTALSIYSLVYTAFGAGAAASAVLFLRCCPERRLTAAAVILAVLSGLSLYFMEGLHIMLLPFAFFILAADTLMIVRKENTDD